MDLSRPNSKPQYGPVEQRALRSVATQFFVNGALFASFMPRLPEIRDRFAISVADIGLLISLAGLSGLLASALVGPAIARLGTRGVMIGAAAMVPLSLVVIGLGPNAWWLGLGLVGMLSFDVPVDVTMNLQGSWLSARRPTPVISRLHGLWSLGTLAGGLASSWLAALGVSLAVHMVSAAAILAATLFYVAPGLLDDDATYDTGNRHQAEAGVASFKKVLPKMTMLIFALAGLFSVVLEITTLDWASFRLADDFASSSAVAALGYASVAGGMTLARLLGDLVVVRVGRDAHAVGSLGLSGVGLAIALLGANPAVSLVGFALAGLGNAALMPLLYDRAAHAPGPTGAGMAALTVGIRLAILSSPLLVGALAGTSLSVAAAMAIVCGPSVIGFYLVGRPIRRAVPGGRFAGGAS